MISGLTLLPALLAAAPPFTSLGPGVEHAVLALPDPRGGTAQLHLVRVTPSEVRFELATVSELGGAPRTAGAWAAERGYLAVINAGMFQTDHLRNVGYLRHGRHVNNPARARYRSYFVFDPAGGKEPLASVLDGDPPGLERYRGVVQNLRLIERPGRGVWAASVKRRWSEAAVAEDREGHILFLFCRAPFTMAELNAAILAAPLGVVAAQHVEGGPEASLSVRGAGLALDLAGSFETGFVENDGNPGQWPLPNVIGVRPR